MSHHYKNKKVHVLNIVLYSSTDNGTAGEGKVMAHAEATKSTNAPVGNQPIDEGPAMAVVASSSSPFP
jgi:hypothetical protein